MPAAPTQVPTLCSKGALQSAVLLLLTQCARARGDAEHACTCANRTRSAGTARAAACSRSGWQRGEWHKQARRSVRNTGQAAGQQGQAASPRRQAGREGDGRSSAPQRPARARRVPGDGAVRKMQRPAHGRPLCLCPCTSLGAGSDRGGRRAGCSRRARPRRRSWRRWRSRCAARSSCRRARAPPPLRRPRLRRRRPVGSPAELQRFARCCSPRPPLTAPPESAGRRGGRRGTLRPSAAGEGSPPGTRARLRAARAARRRRPRSARWPGAAASRAARGRCGRRAAAASGWTRRGSAWRARATCSSVGAAPGARARSAAAPGACVLWARPRSSLSSGRRTCGAVRSVAEARPAAYSLLPELAVVQHRAMVSAATSASCARGGWPRGLARPTRRWRASAPRRSSARARPARPARPRARRRRPSLQPGGRARPSCWRRSRRARAALASGLEIRGGWCCEHCGCSGCVYASPRSCALLGASCP
jgi:hypothetical protein